MMLLTMLLSYELYKSECSNVVRRTGLTHQACYPSPIERQKVSLALKVFNAKTVVALIQNGKTETAMFIDFILTLWKILNIKHPNSHINLNDPIRKPFRSTDNMRFTFLEDAANA